VLFTTAAHAGLADGSITRTYRLWKRPQAKVGGRYHVGPVVLVVEAVSTVAAGDITDSDARQAGFEDATALRTLITRRVGPVDDDTVLWRLDFHAVPYEVQAAPDPAEVDLDALSARLDRLDKASSHGAWTRATLALIGDHPATVSTTLAEMLGRERAPFKVDVRKLKGLGLTESLEVGYRLTPVGQAVLDHR
jgi:hypothetical protein